tara:strand:+ start:268 stop:474 length:207 start_codon:yes stop_codon:yes gene_type:complete
MNEILTECVKCRSKDLKKNISDILFSKKETDKINNKKVGTVVKEFIKDSKEALEKEKEQYRSVILKAK